MSDSNESKIQELLERNLTAVELLSEKLRLNDVRTLQCDDWEKRLKEQEERIEKESKKQEEFKEAAAEKAAELISQSKQLDQARREFVEQVRQLEEGQKLFKQAVDGVRDLKESTIEEMKEILLMIELGAIAQDIETHIKNRFAVLEPKW